jgi:hypothetical protein
MGGRSLLGAANLETLESDVPSADGPQDGEERALPACEIAEQQRAYPGE